MNADSFSAVQVRSDKPSVCAVSDFSQNATVNGWRQPYVWRQPYGALQLSEAVKNMHGETIQTPLS